MSVVAVAGGTGHLGRTIVETLQNTTDYNVITLSQKDSGKAGDKASILLIDYSDTDSTAKLLANNNVVTVISAIGVMNPSSSTAQVNLVRAAAKSRTVKRFVASEWGVSHTEESPVYPFREAIRTELRKTDLEWTRFYNGYFLDYFGLPHVKSYLMPMTFVVDIANKVAAIPGTGNDIVSFTYTFDVAKFVVKLLDLPKWEETTYVYGDKATLNELVKIAEEARGSKFLVKYDPIEKLQENEITELPSHLEVYPFFPKPALQAFLAMFGRWVVSGRFHVPEDKALNAKFPDIQTSKVNDIVGLWKGH